MICLLVHAGIRVDPFLWNGHIYHTSTAGKWRDNFIKKISMYLKMYITIPFHVLQIDLRVSTQDFNKGQHSAVLVVLQASIFTKK